MHFANAHFFQRQSTICELTFPTSILAVKMNRRRLIVVLEEQIFLYDISNMKLLHTIDTRPNPTAICALSPSSENCYVAYPSRSSLASPFMPSTSPSQSNSSALSTGDVELFDALGLNLVNIVQAHKSPVSCMTMNSEGTLLATASEKVLESGLIQQCVESLADKLLDIARAQLSEFSLFQMPAKCSNFDVALTPHASIPQPSIPLARFCVYQVTLKQCISLKSRPRTATALMMKSMVTKNKKQEREVAASGRMFQTSFSLSIYI